MSGRTCDHVPFFGQLGVLLSFFRRARVLNPHSFAARLVPIRIGEFVSVALIDHGDLASALGVRIISPDRPGISGSAFQANRKLIDWPPIAREIADELAIDQFHILAISGGAPYAYVTAWEMPQRVRAIAIVSGALPIVD